jgi:NADP-reducing hydrogenase subunit HndB
MSKLTRQDLEKIVPASSVGPYIKVGMSTCGIAAGAQEVYDIFSQEIKAHNVAIDLKKTGCLGMCHCEPLVEISVEGLPAVTYGRVTKEVALRLVEEHLCQKRLLNDHIYELPVRRS